MAITHTETITNLIVLNDGTDVVSQVAIKIISVDDSDPSNLTKTTQDTFLIDSSGGISAAGFVAYSALTEAVVKSWIADEITERKTKTEAWLNHLKTPPTPTEINKTLPW